MPGSGCQKIGVRNFQGRLPENLASSRLCDMERRSGFEKTANEKGGAGKCFQLGAPRDIWRETTLSVQFEEEAFALPYAHLNFIKCNGDSAVTLSFTSHLVKIQGQRLRPLYNALLDHTVRFVAVIAAPSHEQTSSEETVITSIDLVPLGQADGGMF